MMPVSKEIIYLGNFTDTETDKSSFHVDSSQIGIVMGDYQICSHLLQVGAAPTNLDKCIGYDTPVEGYHYHAVAPGSNEIMPC